MPTLRIEIPEALQTLADGGVEVSAAGTTVKAALAELGSRHPLLVQRILTRGGAMREHVNLFLNDHDVRAGGGLDTPVREGDVLIVVASVSGG